MSSSINDVFANKQSSEILAPETKLVADKQVTNLDTAPHEDQQFLEKVASTKPVSETQEQKSLIERIKTEKTRHEKPSDEFIKEEIEIIN